MKKNFLFCTIFIALIFSQRDIFAQWIQTNGPFGLGLSCFAVNGSEIFTATISADSNHTGVYRSSNKGQSWTYANSGLSLNAKVQAPAAGGNNVFAAVSGIGIYRSSDNGLSWQLLQAGANARFVNALFVKDSFVFAGTEGVLRSTDNGSTWNSADSGLANSGVPVIFSFATDGNTIITGTQRGVFKSTDNGKSWISASNGLPGRAFPRVDAIAVFGSVLFAGVNNGISRSTNGGIDWIDDNSGAVFAQPNSNVLSFAVLNSDIYAAIQDLGVYKRTTNGWMPVNSGLGDLSCQALSVVDSILFVATEYSGIYSLNIDSPKWTPKDKGLPSNPSVSVITTSRGRILAGKLGLLSFSDDNGLNWSESEIQSVDAFASIGTNLFAGSSNGGVFRSSDNGGSWISAFQGLFASAIYCLVARGSLLYVGTDRGVFTSRDSGASWIKTNCPISPTTSLSVQNQDIFAASEQDVYRTTDSGLNWEQVAPPWAYSGSDVVWSVLLASNPQYLLASKNYYGNSGFLQSQIFRSSDEGTTWIKMDSSLPPVWSLCFSGGDMLAGTTHGVFLTTDSGMSWRSVNDGLPDLAVLSLWADSANAYAGVEKNRLWRRSILNLKDDVTPILNPVSEVFDLYPNPSFEKSTITFMLNGQSSIKIEILNLLGENVHTVYEGIEDAGFHTAHFETASLIAGNYFIRFMSNDGESIRRLEIIR